MKSRIRGGVQQGLQLPWQIGETFAVKLVRLQTN
jgi:hypothetical protein